MEILISVAAKVAELLVVPIKKQVCYPFKYENNIKELKKQVEKLTNQREMVQHSVDEATRQGDEIQKFVEEWMNRVEEFSEKVVKPIIDDGDSAKKLCSIGFFPNLMARCSLSKKAEKTAKQGVNLFVEGNFQKVSCRPAIKRTVSVYARGYEEFGSRMKVFEEIMKALVDGDDNLIGVYGMGGVGKTTLVNRVAAQALEDKSFDAVVMAEVTQTLDIRKVQGQIADKLGLKLDVESLSGRADQLRDRLKKETSILLIIDNIWEKLDLDAVGIPSWDVDNSSVTQGGRNASQRKFRLLFTSRDVGVLQNGMNIQKNFLIEILSDVEARNLFWKIAGHAEEEVDLNPIAVEIVKKCDGLPIAITTIASALKNKGVSEWKNARQWLRKSNPTPTTGMEKNVYSTLELSYNILGPEEQSFFLLCSLYPPGSTIHTVDLFNYSVGLGLFKDVDTMEEARNRMDTVVGNLKDSCLLLGGGASYLVKMHDIIHAVAVSIASSKDKLVFSIQNVISFKETLEEKLPKDSVGISLPWVEFDELPEMLEFPKLELFVLFSKNVYFQISDAFFEPVKGLKVLNLTGLKLLTLPSSLCMLTNLQTLCLDGCILEDLAVIGKLKKLDILSLKHTDINELPIEIGQLTRLRLLDLSSCLKLKVITPNILSSLTRLEELYMGDGFVQWDVEGQSNASLAELKKLSNLTALEIHVLDAQIMPHDLFFGKLERFIIFIGDVWKWTVRYETLRTLKLKLNNSFHLSDGIKSLLNRAENLFLDEPKGVENVLQELSGEGFQQLKHLHVQNAPQIQYIINSDGWGLCNVFPHRLEPLFLNNLINLEKIYHGKLTAESLSQLKIIKVGKCDKLKHLIVPSARNLSKIQEIEVTHCKKLEEIVFVESGQVHKSEQTTKLEFGQLRTVTLQCLPRLIRMGFKAFKPNMGSQEIFAEDEPDSFIPFFSQSVLLPVLENLKLSSINIECGWLDQIPTVSSHCQTLKNLTVEGCDGLKFLLSYYMVKSLVQLRELRICNCKSMEGVINTEELANEEILSKMIFPRLIYLELKGLPKLTRFCYGNTIEFPSVKGLEIKDCPKLKAFLSGSTCENVTVSNKREETNSYNDNKVQLPSLSNSELDSISSAMIWNNQLPATFSYIHNLTHLLIDNLGDLKYLFSSSMLKSVAQLEVVEIKNCKLMEAVIVQDVKRPSVLFPKLLYLHLCNLPKLTRFCYFTGMTASEECSGTNSKENLQPNSQPFFDENVGFPSLKILMMEHMDSLRKIWHSQLYSDSFCKLEQFRVRDSKNLLNVFPSNMHERLLRLERLAVENCGLVEEIFELEPLSCKKTHIAGAQLRRLWLDYLPKLKNVWNMDSQVNLSYQNLQLISIQHCDSLKCLFPASVATGLVQLEELYINFCMMEEIIANDDQVKAFPRFVFPKLTKLHLWKMSRLRSLYPRSYISEWPVLKTLIVWKCEEVEILSSEYRSHGENQSELPSGQPLFLIKKVAFPRLRQLALDWNCTVKEMVHGKFTEYSCNINCLGLADPFEKSAICSSCFLLKLPNLQSLAVYDGFLKEFFICDGIGCKKKHVESPIKLSSLELYRLSDSHLWEEASESGNIFQHLTFLKVSECGNLQSLVPFSVSFKNLTSLEVSNCDGLLNLVAVSTAKSLVQLTRMDITDCKMIKEIIPDTEDGADDWIVFNQLKYLGLNCLPSLAIFHSGSCAIEFPSLQQVVMKQCPNMKFFSRGAIRTPRLHTLQISEVENEGCWEGDLNTSLEQLHMEKNRQCSKDE